jgi:hypothetical protein
MKCKHDGLLGTLRFTIRTETYTSSSGLIMYFGCLERTCRLCGKFRRGPP